VTIISTSDTLDHTPLIGEVWDMLAERGWLAERTPDVQSKLRNIAQVRTYRPGEHLYLVGKPPGGIHGLARGAIDISVPREDGQEVVLHRAQAGFWIGDSALFSGMPRLVTVTAATETVAAYLPRTQLWGLLEKHPNLTLDFYVLSHRNMATILQLLANLSIPRAGARIASCLLSFNRRKKKDQDWVLLSQEKLAELSALSLPTVQRTLRHLEETGIVELGYGRLRIRDPQQLSRYSG
jgi:CRP-like cAMP-binding protein